MTNLRTYRSQRRRANGQHLRGWGIVKENIGPHSALWLLVQPTAKRPSTRGRKAGGEAAARRAGDDDGNVVGTYIIILGEAEELADLGGALGAEALGVNDVGDAGDVGVALLDDAEGQHRQVHGDDAAADRLALALAGAAGSVAGVALGEQQAHTGWVHHTLLHGKTLLVVATGDAEDVALELITNAVTWDLGAHSVMVVSVLCFVYARDRYRVDRAYLLSMNTRSFLSSSISMSFWLPLAGCIAGQWYSWRQSRWVYRRTKEMFYSQQHVSTNASQQSHAYGTIAISQHARAD